MLEILVQKAKPQRRFSPPPVRQARFCVEFHIFGFRAAYVMDTHSHLEHNQSCFYIEMNFASTWYKVVPGFP